MGKLILAFSKMTKQNRPEFELDPPIPLSGPITFTLYATLIEEGVLKSLVTDQVFKICPDEQKLDFCRNPFLELITDYV